MPSSPKRTIVSAPPRARRRVGVTLGLLALPLVLGACANGSSSAASSGAATSASPSDTSAAATAATPTGSATASTASGAPSAASVASSPSTATSATSSTGVTPTSSPTVSPTPSGTPSTVAPSAATGVLGMTVVYSPTTASAGQQVSITASTDRSLAGRTAYVIKLNDGAPRVLGTGTALSASGVVRTHVVLLRTGILEVVVPRSPLAAGPFDPTTPLLAASARFTVTIR